MPERQVQRLEALEDKRREKEEAEERKKDRRKLRKMEQTNPAQIMAQVSKANDPMAFRRRTELDLPAPQVRRQRREGGGNHWWGVGASVF